ncbi:MAG TPA: hypothetical protein VFP77_02660 [Gemmatimonadaceae bacterium]|jgi:hypothetical protein|nr:hypothetical protein [Gemmatimonadaceae bacterium]
MSKAPRLTIRIKKNADGRSALTCTRPDGTTTWQSLNATQGRFFPRHDLTHYAVETVLGHRRGFYGLVAEGWNLTDFGAPWPRGRIPAEAVLSETIVGLLDLERATGERVNASDVNARLAEVSEEAGITSPEISDSHLDQIRDKRAELFAEWDAVRPGNALELPFDLR